MQDNEKKAGIFPGEVIIVEAGKITASQIPFPDKIIPISEVGLYRVNRQRARKFDGLGKVASMSILLLALMLAPLPLPSPIKGEGEKL